MARVIDASPAPTRADGRAPDELRPVSIEPRFLASTRASCLIRMGATWVLCSAAVEEQVPPFRQGSGQGLGDQRVRHDPAVEQPAHPLESRHQRRAAAGDQPIDRTLHPRRDRPQQAGRTPDSDRLHGAPGRRRHAHGERHRRLRRARARRAGPARGAEAHRESIDHTGCRGQRRAGRRRAAARPAVRRGLAGGRRHQRRHDRRRPAGGSAGHRRGRALQPRAARSTARPGDEGEPRAAGRPAGRARRARR